MTDIECMQYRRKKAKEYERKNRYGLTPREYEELVMLQQGRCAICDIPMKKPCVDHHHKSGKVRGLLCCGCNTKLSAVDDSRWLYTAMLYIIRSEQYGPTTGS